MVRHGFTEPRTDACYSPCLRGSGPVVLCELQRYEIGSEMTADPRIQARACRSGAFLGRLMTINSLRGVTEQCEADLGPPQQRNHQLRPRPDQILDLIYEHVPDEFHLIEWLVPRQKIGCGVDPALVVQALPRSVRLCRGQNAGSE